MMRGVKRLIIVGCSVALSLTGCAALTNPVANGIPVRILPDELLAESRDPKVRQFLTRGEEHV